MIVLVDYTLAYAYALGKVYSTKIVVQAFNGTSGMT